MKKLILLIALTALPVFAQSTNLNPGPFWTNGVTVYTNLQMGLTVVPLTTNQYKGLVWAAQRWNAMYVLDGTNRYNVRDAAAYAIVNTAGQWGNEYLAEQEARADRVAIRAALIEATEAQLNQIKALLGLQ